MKNNEGNFASNRRTARELWTGISVVGWRTLKRLTDEHCLSVAAGDVILLDGQWYVTHTGLVRLARRNRCAGIDVKPVQRFCDPTTQRWAFEATVFKSKTCRGFVGYGDADPSNVSSLVRGAEMRVAETRAVNRALRKAYGIGICSVEEIGRFPRGVETEQQPGKPPPQSSNGNGKGNGSSRVRDRLVQLIRQHQLDPDLVKAYAIDFCGAKTLKEAARAQVEAFIDHLADWAATDRDALLCQLNSYPHGTDKNEENAGAA
jgi:hypothetical protein